ncbi:MAG: DUF2750 domain-containing protein [bacterium]|nr:DUF2750 domain-containing protein [bacterium]
MIESPQLANARYRRFVEEVQQTGCVWGLFEGTGWANWSDEEVPGGRVIPFWSSEQDACANAVGGLSDYTAESVLLDEFVGQLLAILEEHGLWVGVNLTPERTGISVPPAVLKEELEGLPA